MPDARQNVGLAQVAELAGVSIATASLVLNPSNRKYKVGEGRRRKVLDAARQPGYASNYHARSMKSGRAEAIGVALDHLSRAADRRFGELGSSYFGALLGAIELTARRMGHALVILGPEAGVSAPDRGVQAVRERQLDGLILPGVWTTPGARRIFDDPPDVPIVGIEYTTGPTNVPVVDFDDAVGIALTVRHLAELGHRELLWLGPEQASSPTPHRREQLFMADVWEAGLRGQSCRYVRTPSPEAHPVAQIADAAAAALGNHLREGPPRSFTAIVCYNDATAIGAYAALADAGLSVPRDVSVVGFDDLEAPLLHPKLTTISHMLAEMGRKAVELLIEITQDPKARQEARGRRIPIVPELVVRQSTAPPTVRRS